MDAVLSSSANNPSPRVQEHVVIVVLTNHQVRRRVVSLIAVHVVNFGTHRERLSDGTLGNRHVLTSRAETLIGHSIPLTRHRMRMPKQQAPMF
jgi:hypothetical protein